MKIAVLRALNLGDCLLAVPALRALRAGYPDAEITFIGLPWAREFVHRYPYLDRFVEFAGYPGIDEVPVDKERTARFLAEQRAYGYDLVIQMHGSGATSLPLAFALGGRQVAGYYSGDRPEGLLAGEPYPSHLHEIRRNLRLVRLLGCPDIGTDLEFPLTGADRRHAATLLQPWRPGPTIGIHPGARPPSRRWPAERFAAVADDLARRFGASIVITGGPGEEEIAERVISLMEEPAVSLAGRTTIGSLAAVIARLDLFVSNDTGPAHLAVAVDTPSLIVWGPSDHHRWAPLDRTRHPIVRRDVPCYPCAYWECPIDHRCLQRIGVEEVLAGASRLLAQGAASCSA